MKEEERERLGIEEGEREKEIKQTDKNWSERLRE